MKDQILDFLTKRDSALNREKIDLTTNLFEGGILDSFGLVDLVSYLEGETGLSISDDDLNDPRFTSVVGIAEIIERKKGA